MAKLKTNSAAKKRFRVASGNVKRAKAYRRHLLTKKTSKRKRGLRATAYVGSANIYAIRELLAGRNV